MGPADPSARGVPMASGSKRMSLLRLVRMAGPDLMSAYLAGEISREDLWTAAEGAGEYREAVASGDLAAADAHLRRSVACAGCPRSSRTGGRPDGSGREIEKIWCGERFRGPAPLCGCLVALSVGGEILPGAKTAIASAVCPDDPPRWGPEPRLPR